MHNDPVRQLALEYARSADDREFEAMRAIITEDFSQQGPHWRCDGADAFIAQLDILKQRFDATLHMVGNQFGTWTGDRYRGETYCIATHVYEQEGVSRKLEMGIRYQDDIAREGDDYRYVSRDLRIVWTADQPVLIPGVTA